MSRPKKPRRGAKARPLFLGWDGEEPLVDEKRARRLKDPQARIEYMAELLAEQKWFGRRSERELERIWKLSTARIQQMRESAAAVNRSALGGHKEIQTLALMMLRNVGVVSTRKMLEKGQFAFKWGELAVRTAEGYLAFTSREFDERLARRKDGRDAERHERDMRQGVTTGPITLEEVLKADRASKENTASLVPPDAPKEPDG